MAATAPATVERRRPNCAGLITVHGGVRFRMTDSGRYVWASIEGPRGGFIAEARVERVTTALDEDIRVEVLRETAAGTRIPEVWLVTFGGGS